MEATNSATNQTLSYCFVAGLFGGKGHRRRLDKSLAAKGYKLIDDPAKAEIVIAHSGGSLLLNHELSARLLVLVGAALPHEDGRQTFKKANRWIWKLAYQDHYLLSRLHWSLVSLGMALREPRRNAKIVRLVRSRTELAAFNKVRQVVFVANQNDPWPHSPKLQPLLKARPWAFISLRGSHENIWEQPEQYAAIIDHYARELLV